MSRILIVDDDNAALLLYKKELTEDGYDVVTASDGVRALDMFRSERPDLVILDLRMPGMDGIETMARILAIDRSIPVILMSAFSYYRDNFLSWAASAYIEKSSSLESLKSAVQQLLSSRVTQSSSVSEGRITRERTIWGDTMV